MANVKFHHNSLNQFLFQTPDGVTLNIPPGQEVVTTEEIARFILEQVKSGGGTYTATSDPIHEDFEVELKTEQLPMEEVKPEVPIEPEGETDPGLKPFSQTLNESEDVL